MVAEVGRKRQEERRALEALAARGDGLPGQRARAILAWQAEADLERAARTAGLRPAQVRYWVQAFKRGGIAALVRPQPPAALQPPPAAEPPAGPARPPAPRRRLRGPRLRAADPVSTGLCRILAFHFAKVKKLEPAAFEADEDAVHDMRVAMRRLRAAMRIARPFFRRKPLGRLRGFLQDTAAALGAVRDLDVILAHARAYVARQPEGAGELDGWLADLASRRAEARLALRDHLAGKSFRRLRREFQAFLAEARGAGSPLVAADAVSPPRIRDVLASAVWVQYGRVRAHESVQSPTPESLHVLRIEIKRLRYLLEAFQSVLGLRVLPAVDLAVRAQDHLGGLHDAWVAAGMLRARIGASEGIPAATLTASVGYLAELQREIEERMAAFPALWEELTSLAFRRRLARLLARV